MMMPTAVEERTTHSVTHHPHKGWIYAPHRIWLRRALFQVHLWVGIVLTLYAILIGISGSALVFKDELARSIQPAVYRVTPGQVRVPLAPILQQIEASRAGWKVGSLLSLNKPDQAVAVLLHPAGKAPTDNYRFVAVNPYTGAIVADQMRYAGVLGWLSSLHYDLLGGAQGRAINGWMAVGLLILCLTGLVLWWPGIRRWTRALLLHRRHSWRRVNWDLHTVIGFWSCAALTVVTLTGIYFCFPKPFEATLQFILREHPPAVAHIAPSKPSVATVMDIDAAIAHANSMLPANAPVGFLSIPGGRGATYFAVGYYRGAMPYSKLVSLAFDGRTGAVISDRDTTKADLGDRILQYTFAVHYGAFGGEGLLGVVVKILWVLLGLVPAMLGVTGVLMYWNRKLRPMLRRA
ncbi:PepSY-associated TM helix domain-containing protein [Silvibacterium sp.]|uniref:PepSY-associated TM helix domain-containing protein n=1 Tax=Silvibacterium sp. TaxID=1964179 RepID=UPI0039E473D8